MATGRGKSNSRPPLAIIGPGRLGTALGLGAARSGWPVAAVGARDLARAASLAEAIGPGVRAGGPADAAGAGQLVLLTVNDEAIGPVCDDLAARSAFRPGAVVAHCCGALGSEILASARRRCRCAIGSMHPLQTFASVEAADRLSGAYFFCEGDQAALAALKEFVRCIGGNPVQIDADKKAAYHAGAVMACNYFVALLDAAAGLMRSSGIQRRVALAALAPILRATLENVVAVGPEQALTGPVARGDVDTVRRHLDAISKRGDIDAFYRAAGRWTVALARRKGTLNNEVARKLEELLADDMASAE